MLSYVHRFRAFMWTDKTESSKLHLNGYFSKKSEKKFSVFRNIRIRLETQQSNHFCSIEAHYAAWECTNFHEKKLPLPPQVQMLNISYTSVEQKGTLLIHRIWYTFRIPIEVLFLVLH